MKSLPPSPEGILLAHFIVSDDVERSRRFYTEVLGGRVAFPGDPVNVALANSWIVINAGGGPTDDKPGRPLTGHHDHCDPRLGHGPGRQPRQIDKVKLISYS